MFFNGHNHTMYSNLRLLDCIIKPKDLIDKAIELGLSGIAITDHEALSAHMEVNMYAKKLREKYPDFTIALGNEIYLMDERTKGQDYYHFILIAKDAYGHKCLREMSSKAWYNSYWDRGMERVPLLKQELYGIMNDGFYRGHIMATTACLGGELPKLISFRYGNDILPFEIEEYDYKIHAFMKFCINTFTKDCFFLECAPSTDKEQILVNRKLWELGQEYGVRVTVATDSHYLTKDTRFAHKAYLNSKNGEREVDKFYEFARLMDEEEVRSLLRYSFDDETIIDEIFETTEFIRQGIEFYSLEKPQQIPLVRVPERDFLGWAIPTTYPTLNRINQSGNAQEQKWLDDCMVSLEQHNISETQIDEYMERLEIEADVIDYIGQRLGNCLFAYFNTFKHYIDLFWSCGSIVGPGRGSSTGFLSNYLLGITQLDPIRWKLPWWRFLNKERAELPDIDIDLAPSKRPEIFKRIREERGELGLVQVVTFGTEGTKSAIQTACRGYRHTDPDTGLEEYPDGIDVDIAQYMSSLIPQERGFLWPIKDVVYGNEDLGRKPIQEFIREVGKYEGLLSIITNIEGIVKQRGIHASGVIMYDEETIHDTAAIMRAPSGELVTCYDLHMAEAAGDTKYDFLVTEISDKMIKCIELMHEDHVIEDGTLRETYNKYLHPENIDTQSQDIWDALSAGNVLDVFQFGTGVGLAIAKKLRPQNPIEMTAANAMMRLMSEPGVESQQDRYYRIQQEGIGAFEAEMRQAGISEDVKQAMHEYCDEYWGCAPTQEQMMQILMDERLCKFTLGEANAARKIVAKKKMSQIPELREHVFASNPYAEYIWKTAVAPQLGYAFSVNHALPYSFVGIQSLILGTRYNPVYWNTACLIVNSGATDEGAGGSTDYGKIAKAIGDIKSRGIKVCPPNINESEFGFRPKAATNEILFGLKGLLNVGDDVITEICEKRPFVSLYDFLARVNAGKQAIVALIKSGAFDQFGERRHVMAEYIFSTCDRKKRLTLQNMNGLIQRGLIPDELGHQRAVFEFNRYLKDKCNGINGFRPDARAMAFLDKFYEVEFQFDADGYYLDKKVWDKIYQSEMDAVRQYLKDHQEEMLYELNKMIFMDDWNKYAKGSYSAWEMEVMCFYEHEHELARIDKSRYGISNFYALPEEPPVDKLIYKKGAAIPLYKLTRICGTCIAKNKTKGDVTLLTTDGIVNVWFRKEYFALFDKQISVRGADGVKHVVEKSWFNRGSMIMVTGIRRGDEFIPKKYSTTPGHQLYKITSVSETGDMILQAERTKGEAEDGD